MKALLLAACVLLAGCNHAKTETIQASRKSLSKYYEHITFEGWYSQLIDYVDKNGVGAEVYSKDYGDGNGEIIPVIRPIGKDGKSLGLCHANGWFTEAEGIEVVCVATDSSGRALDPRIERLEYRNAVEKGLY